MMSIEEIDVEVAQRKLEKIGQLEYMEKKKLLPGDAAWTENTLDNTDIIDITNN